MTDSPTHSPAQTEALAEPERPAAALPASRRYHVALTPSEVIARLSEQGGVKAFTHADLPDFGGVAHDAAFTLEHGSEDFAIHAGPPAARGQSATGMLRLLYLRGRLSPTSEGTSIELSFALRRPRWALQRYAGFVALASLALLWVVMTPGQVLTRAPVFLLLLAVLGPVLIHDLRRGDAIEDQRRALLNLIEHTFGAIQLDDPHPDEPYRRRVLGAGKPDAQPAAMPDDDDDDDDEDDEL